MGLDLNNPTQELTKTTFYQKYQEGKSKIQNIKNNINEVCESTNTTLESLIGKIEGNYEDAFSKYIDLAQSMYNTIADATQCISGALGVDVDLPAKNLKEEVVNSIQKILDFDQSLPLNDLLVKIAELESQIEQAIQQGCEAITNIINDAYSELQQLVNNAVDKVNDMINGLKQYTELLNEVAKTMAKIAAVANCIGDAAGSLAQQAAIFDPKTASILQNVANTSGSVNDKMKAGIDTLKQVQDVPNKLTSFTNTLKF